MSRRFVPARTDGRKLLRLRLETSGDSGLGQLAFFTLVASFGLLVIALAYTTSREGGPGANGLWWAGLVVIFVPVILRQFAVGIGRRERIGLVLLLGIAFLLVKSLYAPLKLQFSDEFFFWRSASDILQRNHLFFANHSLEVKPFYPGLQAASAAVARIGGVDVTAAGLLIVNLLRPVYAIALFLVYERISRSDRIAGIAATLYMSNPNFLFFDSMYIYEAFALPLAVLALYFALRIDGRHGAQAGLMFLILGAGVAMSHHVTGFFLAAYLVLWVLLAVWDRIRGRRAHIPALAAGWMVLLVASWITNAAPQTFQYFAPRFSTDLARVRNLSAAGVASAASFSPPQGPLAETIVSIAAALLILITLAVTLRLAWSRYGSTTPARLALLTAWSYGAVLALRVAPDGTELAGRAMPFVYLPLAFALAAGLTETKRRLPGRLRVVPVVVAVVIFLGGITSSFPAAWARLPGPYVPSAWQRSSNRESEVASIWVGRNLPAGQGVAADQGNIPYLASFANEVPTDVASWVFFARQTSAEMYRTLIEKHIGLIVVDLRLSTARPQLGYYFYSTEPGAHAYRQPLDANLLTKFQRAEFLDRVYDSGDIAVYTVRK